jgi:very-short-patch-repair endonuclease
MESRIRMALVLAGLPRPAVQHPVVLGSRLFRLDLAYPRARLGIEYDGELHRSQQRARRDLEREALLTAGGWTVLRFDAAAVLRRPRAVAALVERELVSRSVR